MFVRMHADRSCCSPINDKNDVRDDDDDNHVSTDVTGSCADVTTSVGLLSNLQSKRHAAVRRQPSILWAGVSDVRRREAVELCPLDDEVPLTGVQLQPNGQPLHRVPEFSGALRACRWLCRLRGD